MIGVTVITSWTYAGVTKAFRTYTRITDGRPQPPVDPEPGARRDRST